MTLTLARKIKVREYLYEPYNIISFAGCLGKSSVVLWSRIRVTLEGYATRFSGKIFLKCLRNEREIKIRQLFN